MVFDELSFSGGAVEFFGGAGNVTHFSHLSRVQLVHHQRCCCSHHSNRDVFVECLCRLFSGTDSGAVVVGVDE